MRKEPVLLMGFLGTHYDDPSVSYLMVDVMKPGVVALVDSPAPAEGEVQDGNLARAPPRVTIVRCPHGGPYRAIASLT